MILQTAQDRIDELDEILELEREALVQGKLGTLESLLERKEELITDLNTLDELEQDTLSNLHKKVARNQNLLEGAMKGIRAVSHRMQELRRVRTGLDVYDKVGKKNSFSTSSSLKLEKRA